jgi:hypothetical protein
MNTVLQTKIDCDSVALPPRAAQFSVQNPVNRLRVIAATPCPIGHGLSSFEEAIARLRQLFWGFPNVKSFGGDSRPLHCYAANYLNTDAIMISFLNMSIQ